MAKRVAVIGAGMSGLTSVAALKEVGLDPVCFEASDRIGGRWCYREESPPGRASIMSTTVSRSSKEMNSISNFPPPKEFSTYMGHRQMLQYIQLYAAENDLLGYVQLNSEVVLVKSADDRDDRSGRFSVAVKNAVTGVVDNGVYDGVIVATGQPSYPRTVAIEGQEKFDGTIGHSHSLKRAEPLKGKNVLVVGGGCSALDAAEVVSAVAKSVYLSCRSGFINLCRQGQNGYPLDQALLRRYLSWSLQVLPISICSWYVETFYADAKFDRHLYRVPPERGVLSKGLVLNDAIGSRLLSGLVSQKPGVQRLTERGVVFDGEPSATEVDSVILATGYDFQFPFLEEGLLDVRQDGRIDLYKCVYPVRLGPGGGLAFVGFVQPNGPGFPVSEMQARHAAGVLAGRVRLPSRAAMLEEVVQRHERNSKRYSASSAATARTDYLPYMDDLASDIGCMPSLLKCLFSDWALLLRLVLGPALPFQYRLQGPFSWQGAREAIFSSWGRLLFPLVRDRGVRKSRWQVLAEFLGGLLPSPRNIFGF